MIEVPSPTTVRDYFALNNDSCWRYRFTRSNATLFSRVDITGPNDTSIAGSTVYVRKFLLESGGLPIEWFLDTESDGAVRLLRSTAGRDRDSRETRRFEGMMPPLFAQLEFDFTGELKFEGSFQTDVVPVLCTGADQTCGDGVNERHSWNVLGQEMVNTPDGDQMAVKLNYTITTDASSQTAQYFLVPNRGIAKFTDFDGTFYQVCDWRVCDSNSSCVGATSCNELTCLP